jgi:hypothetical protein
MCSGQYKCSLIDEILRIQIKHVSVVDYIIASSEYLKHITNLQVLEFNKFFQMSIVKYKFL